MKPNTQTFQSETNVRVDSPTFNSGKTPGSQKQPADIEPTPEHEETVRAQLEQCTNRLAERTLLIYCHFKSETERTKAQTRLMAKFSPLAYRLAKKNVEDPAELHHSLVVAFKQFWNWLDVKMERGN